MYIDARKFAYENFDYPDAARLVERDKEVARDAYRQWLENNVTNIVDRQWEINDIGAVERVGDFIKLLKEAEFTYALGIYISCIALVGVCAEDLCRFFAATAGHNMDGLTQQERVRSLLKFSAISTAVSDRFDLIRKLRNDCLHFNVGFKEKDSAALRADALLALNTIKAVYAEIVGVVDYKTVDGTKFSEMIDAVSREASGSGIGALGLDSCVTRTRNLFASVFGFDMSMNSARPVYSTSMFVVMAVNADEDPPEIDLRDLGSGMIVIVDLTEEELKAITAESIDAKDIVAGTLISVPNKLETTAQWRLWSPLRKLA